jgi:site-specific recombinase XerC
MTPPSSKSAETVLKGKQTLKFPTAVRSYLGHLVGTQKALLTVQNYRTDLNTFEEFLKSGLGSKPVELGQLRLKDLEAYPQWLKAKGYRTNTRRRKLLTVRRFLGYLKKRKKIALDASQKIPTPHKIERIPKVIDSVQLREKIRKLPVTTPLDLRNQALLWTLLESGCLVSEIATLRFDEVRTAAGGETAFFDISGKNPRSVPISLDLAALLLSLRKTDSKSPWIFHGFNRFGPLRSPMTSRGVELVLRTLGPRLGEEGLLAKQLRASAVLFWSRQGTSREEIRKRLGLRTDYAFRAFDPLIRKARESEPEVPQIQL